jgi:hypothetical protein
MQVYHGGMEARLTAKEAHPETVKACPRAMENDHRAVKANVRKVETHPGSLKAQPGGMEDTLKSCKSSSRSHGGSPWSY